MIHRPRLALILGTALLAVVAAAAYISKTFEGGPVTLGPCDEQSYTAVETGASKLPSRVVLVTIDTLRPDHLGFGGYPRDTSPFLDEMAQEGVVFERAIASSSHTAPSHASILTGLAVPRHGVAVNGQGLSDEIPRLACLFEEAGFRTAAVMSVPFLKPLARGFGSIVPWNRELGEAPRSTPRSDETLPYRTSSEVVDQALRILDTSTDERLFLWLHLFDVHEWKYPSSELAAEVDWSHDAPPTPGEDLYEYVVGLHDLERPGGESDAAAHWGLYLSRDGDEAPLPTRSPDEIMQWIDRYDERIRLVDGQLRRLSEYLEAARLPGETLWVIAGDHGEGLGSHGYHGHGKHLYNAQLRVPLLLVSPERWPARRSSSLIRLTDLFPTLADLVGFRATAHEALEGESLLPWLNGEAKSPEKRVAYSLRRHADEKRERFGWAKEDVDALQDGSYKYIRHSDASDELYDLRIDPVERHNLIADEPVVAEGMRRWLSKLDSDFAAPGADLSETEELDPEMEKQLRALGYLN